MIKNWYMLSEQKNGTPVMYAKNPKFLYSMRDNFLISGEIHKLDHKPAQLEFIVKEDGETIASFEFEPHAIKYNLEILNWKGEIIPNPQKSQLELDL